MERRAIGLFSGGLDSLLAARLLQRLGFDVVALHLRTGFGRESHERSCERRRANPALRVETVDVAAAYLREVVIEPHFGRGSAMNPTLDCRVFMLRVAAERARRAAIDWVFTGDVLGQRGMDQSRSAFRRIDAAAGLEGRVLRPLSAGLLPPALPEEAGSVARGDLGRLHGRARRGQLELAGQLGVDDFPTPSGGCCRLAQAGFARRLRDQLEHDDDPARADPELLGRGRHFRLAWDLKLVLGRDAQENAWLQTRRAGCWVCQVAGGRGALALIVGDPGERWPEAAALVARYSSRRGEPRVDVVARRDGEERRWEVAPLAAERIEDLRI